VDRLLFRLMEVIATCGQPGVAICLFIVDDRAVDNPGCGGNQHCATVLAAHACILPFAVTVVEHDRRDPD
jgi:hypothetical protein